MQSIYFKSSILLVKLFVLAPKTKKGNAYKETKFIRR